MTNLNIPAVEGDDASAAPAAAPAAPPMAAPAAAEEELEWGMEMDGTWYPLCQLTFVVEITYDDGSTAMLHDRTNHPVDGP